MNIDSVRNALEVLGEAENDQDFLDWIETERKELEDDYAEYETTRHSGDDQAETFATWALMKYIETLEKKGTARSYTFKIFLSGVGADAQKAWNDAVEGFTMKPGPLDKSSIEHVETI